MAYYIEIDTCSFAFVCICKWPLLCVSFSHIIRMRTTCMCVCVVRSNRFPENFIRTATEFWFHYFSVESKRLIWWPFSCQKRICINLLLRSHFNIDTHSILVFSIRNGWIQPLSLKSVLNKQSMTSFADHNMTPTTPFPINRKNVEI